MEVFCLDDTINLHMIGMKLREAREKRHLTQAEVAEMLGIHTNSYGNFERGTERPSLIKIIQCSIILGIQPGDLLNDCAPGLQKQALPSGEFKNREMQDLVILLNHCPNEMIHQIYIALQAIQDENAQKTRS